MSSNASYDFIDAYLRWIKENSVQKTIGDFEEITTPFVDSHNDQIQFYITTTDHGYLLTDDGYTISDLEMCGCDIKSKKRQEMIRQFAESLGVHVDGNAICIEATANDIARKQHVLIQAMLKIGDVFLTFSSRVKSLFLEEVGNYFNDNDIRNTSSIILMGQSGLSHRFDFVIPASKSRPERVITTLNAPSKQNVQAAIFAWNDIAKIRNKNQQGYVILNNEKKDVNPELMAAIRSYDLIPIPWKQRADFLNDLAS